MPEEPEKYCNSLNGRWKREDWDKLKNLLLNEFSGFIEDAKGFEESMENLKKSNRQFIDVALGFEITIHLPMDMLEDLDKSGSKFMDAPENDAVARLITDELRKLRKMIER